jgi:6-phosphogluconolactonase
VHQISEQEQQGLSMDVAVRTSASLLLALGVVACGGGGNSTETPQYSISGTVTGLVGSGLALRNGGGTSFNVTSNGSFTLPGTVAANSSYDVTFASQPSSPTQSCVIANSAGTASANVSNVAVTCNTPTYPVGGTTTGVEGDGLVVQLNNGATLPQVGDGVFSFFLASGSTYSITVKTQPTSPRQTCTVANGSGTVSNAVITNVTVSCRTLVAQFLYVPNTGTHDISAYTINPATGALSTVPGSPFASGKSPQSVTPDPAETILYSSNSGAATAPSTPTAPNISTYVIASTGALSEVTGSPFAFMGSGASPGSLQSPLTFAASGKFAYASAVNGALSIYAMSVSPATGALTTIPGSPYLLTTTGSTIVPGRFSGAHFYVPYGFSPGSIAIYDFDAASGALMPSSVPSVPTGGNSPFAPTVHPTGKYLYVPNLATGSVSAFGIDSITGLLSPLPNSPSTTGGTFPIVPVIHPSGRFLYIANGNSLFNPAAPVTVAAFVVDSATGALTAVTGSPFLSGGSNVLGDPGICQIDSRGKFLLVTHSATNSVAVFSINQDTGALTAVPGSPFAVGSKPATPMIDPSGKYVYVVNRSSNDISSYMINHDTGALTLINTMPTGSTPASGRYVGLQ